MRPYIEGWFWHDVLTLKYPPIRFRRSIPLPHFTLGYAKYSYGRVLACGWWGIRIGRRVSI